METIKWRPAPGFDGLYEVSEDGRVRSTDRWVPSRARARRLNGVELKQTTRPTGRRNVVLSAGGKAHCRAVHNLVAEAFHGPIPEGHRVYHVDGNPANNHVSNLTVVPHRGSSTSRTTGRTFDLTAEETADIRRLARGHSDREAIAIVYGIPVSLVNGIANSDPDPVFG